MKNESSAPPSALIRCKISMFSFASTCCFSGANKCRYDGHLREPKYGGDGATIVLCACVCVNSVGFILYGGSTLDDFGSKQIKETE